MRKEAFVLLAVVLVMASLLLSGCSAGNGKSAASPAKDAKKEATETLNAYYAAIDYACKASSDCEIKNIANCCGQYPQCVNRNAKTDPELVAILCAKEGAASVCGFPSISSCECINNRCEGR